MFFYLSKLISALIWPSSVITIMLLAGILLVLAGWAVRWARRLLVAGITLLIACGFGPVGNILILPLEERFERGPLPEEIAGVIMLGGFEQSGVTAARGQLNLNESAERLTESIRIALIRPRATVVFTGGDATVIGEGPGSAAGPIGDYLAAVGIPSERTLLEQRSRTTWENAFYLQDMLKPQPGQRYVLVTSAFHMPRSVGTFRKLGFDVVPWPVDFRTRGTFDVLTFSSSSPSGLERVDLAFKEWVGLLAYWATGRQLGLWPSSEAGSAQSRPASAPLPAH